MKTWNSQDLIRARDRQILVSLLLACLLYACDDTGGEGGAGMISAPANEVTKINEGGAGVSEGGAGEDEPAGEVAGMEMDPEPEFTERALKMLELVNQFRASGGTCGGASMPAVPPLSLHRLLNASAQAHAADMAANNYFQHESLDGRTPHDRIAATGYRAETSGENIAAGNESAADTFVQWRESPGHCTNMLRDSYTELGVGYVSAPFSGLRYVWVQNFGRPQ